MTAATPTIASLLRARIGDDHVGCRFEGESWTWDEVVRESAVRAAVLRELLDPDRPAHVGVLLENVPEYLFWLGGAALAGATVVGINPTRRGAELAGDVRHTDCQGVVTDRDQAALLDGLDLGVEPERLVCVDDRDHALRLHRHRDADLPELDPPPSTPLALLFTSGSTSAPKAVVCTTGRLAMIGVRTSEGHGITPDEVCYCPMPLFHGNALMACWAPALAQGATVVLRRRFSASGFLPDVREHGCTYFTYVGRTIAYILAQPPTDHDRDHRLRLGFGTEASAQDRDRFLARFGCPLLESYGSSEGAIAIVRTPDTPPNALGRPRPDLGSGVTVVDPATGEECPPARLDPDGRLLNPDEAIGELVDRSGGGSFEGYYRNDEATALRLRDGWYWSGDLAYRDEDGFFYFAGRSGDWLRVDSENFAAAPIERILHRDPSVVMAAVYPVPDPRTGDQVMAALELVPGSTFDPEGFRQLLAEQRDLGTKWAPRFVRIVTTMPLTANNKLHKPPLRAEGWECTDPVWWQPDRGGHYRLLDDGDRATLRASFAEYGRLSLLAR